MSERNRLFLEIDQASNYLELTRKRRIASILTSLKESTSLCYIGPDSSYFCTRLNSIYPSRRKFARFYGLYNQDVHLVSNGTRVLILAHEKLGPFQTDLGYERSARGYQDEIYKILGRFPEIKISDILVNYNMLVLDINPRFKLATIKIGDLEFELELLEISRYEKELDLIYGNNDKLEEVLSESKLDEKIYIPVLNIEDKTSENYYYICLENFYRCLGLQDKINTEIILEHIHQVQIPYKALEKVFSKGELYD